ncbi:MAG: helix-turn-helix domain-containing protein [Cyclobacteriaceae bacterium]|nr:helix-turn-helix domain-containing protein [Cyclobacteriaceae bacterium]
MVFAFGAAAALFFEFLLLSKKQKTLADNVLSVWMFFIALNLFLFYVNNTEALAYKYPFLLGVNAPIPFVHGPFLFLYTQALAGNLTRWKSITFLHFIPVPLFYLANINFYLNYSTAEKIEFVEKVKAGNAGLFFSMAAVLMIASAITYLILTFFQYSRHHKNIVNNLSFNDERVNLHWLRNLLIGMSVIWLVVIIANLNIPGLNNEQVIYTTVVLFVLSIGYFGVRQGNIFTSTPVASKNKTDEQVEKRYAKSGLKEADMDSIEKELKHLMETEELFLDENITLPKLAEQIGISANNLSQVINDRFQKNFYDFINSYRIKRFKLLAKDPKKRNYTILALAYECGFNSKSSFNKYFKSATNTTPSEYFKSVVQDL